MVMEKVNFAELKREGFTKQVQKDHFSLRLHIVGGQITSKQLQVLGAIADEYGHGYVHLTSRQGLEIPFIKLEHVQQVKEKLAEGALETGAGGPRVRTITACQGKNVCPHGLIDTTGLARALDQKHYGRELPHKFKLGITGCRNNCLKAEENDLGIKGGMIVQWNQERCSFCGLCAAVCPVKAIAVNKDRRKLRFRAARCVHCGRCVKKCPLEAWEGQAGYLVFFGGLFGNRIALGKQLFPIVHSLHDLNAIIDRTLDFFAKYGKPGERFRHTVERTGWAVLTEELAYVIQNPK